MSHFLLPDPVAFKNATSFVSLISTILLLPANHKTVVALRLGLEPNDWTAASVLEYDMFARAVANCGEVKLYAARCGCGPHHRVYPKALLNPPEGFCVYATIKHGKIKVLADLFPHDSIEAKSADWELWLHPDFCCDLLKRHPSQREVDRVCEALVERALAEGNSYTRKEFIAAVRKVLTDAKYYQVDDFRRRRHGPWKAEAGRRRKTSR